MTEGDEPEPTPTDVVSGLSQDTFQGLVDVRLESGQVITGICLSYPLALVATPFNNRLGFDALPQGQALLRVGI